MITYYIQHIENKNEIYYFDTLKEAKRALTDIPKFDLYRIVKLIGQYKYEGFPRYYMHYDGKKFSKELIPGSLAKNKLR